MKHLTVTIAIALMLLLASAGAFATNDKKVDGTNWKQAQATNTVEGYLRYLRQAQAIFGAHMTEAAVLLKPLMQADLASMKEVTLTAQVPPVAGQIPVSADVLKVVSDALQKQGYQIVGSDCPNQVVISIQQKRLLAGTAKAYWHYLSVTSVNLAFSRGGVRLFSNQIISVQNEGKDLHTFSGIAVAPVDDTGVTYIDPIAGTASGTGVQYISPQTDPNAIAADKKAFDDYDWAGTLDANALVEQLKAEFAGAPALSITDSTQWIY